jgi:hypothetical protein
MEKDKTIFRVAKNKDNPFVMIDRRVIENPSLSWKAKGLLAYLLSRPDDWVVRFRDLVNRSPDGGHTVRAAMKELRRAGHVQVEAEREGGRVKQWVYTVHESPDDDFQQVEKQQVENRTHTNTKNTNKNQEEEEANPLEKFDDPEFGEIITDWNNLHTFLIPTHANLLACMLDEWRDHQKKLPAGHPDKSLNPVAIFREAMIITGKSARNPHSLSYMDRVIKNWIHLGYGYGPNGTQPKNKNGKPQQPTVADNWLARKQQEEANGNS